MSDNEPDMVNHPPHYFGPSITFKVPQVGEYVGLPDMELTRPVECIELMRHIKDPRLATAFTYLWRVALGGSKGRDVEDIGKARWFLTDFIDHPPETL
jgi:hypothetical protein